MTKITPIPKDLIGFVTRFPGLTASGISQLMGKKSDWASGALSKMVKAGRLAKRMERGMTKSYAWRYYPAGRRVTVCPFCKVLLTEIKALKCERDHLKSILDT